MTNEEHTNDAQSANAAEAKVEKMFEYGYRKSNYGPDELVTDAHGNPISVVDAMLSAEDAAKAETSTPHLCYNSPRHPGNTGSAIRLCAVTGTILHLVEPLGFNLRDTKLRRAGLDYHDMAHVVLHPNFENLVESMPNSRIIAFTAHATKLYTDIEYKPTDILLFGPEPGNIPDPMDIMAGPHVAEQVRLPMRPSLRSLNLTNSASIAIYEAWRQLGFAGGQYSLPCLPTFVPIHCLMDTRDAVGRDIPFVTHSRPFGQAYGLEQNIPPYCLLWHARQRCCKQKASVNLV